MNIKISDFTKKPFYQFKDQVKNSDEKSGEEFRDIILYPAFLETQKNHEKLIVELDGVCGYSTLFLDEAFGGLVRKLKIENYCQFQKVQKIELSAYFNAYLIEYIKGIINSEINKIANPNENKLIKNKFKRKHK